MKKTIEDQLRQAVDAWHENRRTIALNSEVEAGILSRFMRGERGVSLATAAKLAAYLGLSLKR